MDDLGALLARIGSDRDLAALGDLFDRAAPDLLRLALRVTGDATEAEDVLQDTFLAVWKGARTFDPGRPASAWLATVLANVASRRRRRRTPGLLPDGVDAPAPGVTEGGRGEDWRRARAAIEGLPPRERSAMVLRYEHGLSPEGIAEVLSVSESSARSLLARGTSRLRRRLPAVALAFPRFPRPTAVDVLARVRDAVLHASAAAAAPAAVAGVATGASIALTGGALMTAKQALGIAAVVLLLGGGGLWVALREPPLRPDGAGEGTPPRVADASPEAAARPGLGVTSEPARPRAAGESAAPRYAGRVHDDRDRPVPGVELEIREALRRDGALDVKGLSRVAADTEGRFAFEVRDSIGQVTVRVHASGHVPLWGGRDLLVFPGHPAEIVLVPAREVRVVAREAATSSPVGGASVRVYGPMTSSVDALRSSAPADEATTDEAQGRAVLHAPLGIANVVVRAEGFANLLVPAVDVGPAGADVTARLARGTRIEGRFEDPSGAGKRGLLVVAYGFPLYEARTGTGDDGRFVLEHAPSSADPVEPYLRERLALMAQEPGRSPRWFPIDPPAEGETKSVTIVWEAERPLRGRAHRSDGSPVALLEVAPLPVGPRTDHGLGNWSAVPVRTDEDGRFSFDGVGPGRHVLRAWRGSGWSSPLAQRTIEIPVRGEVPEVDLVVDEVLPTRIVVRVTDSDGRPLEGADVRWAVAHGEPQVVQGKTSRDGEAILEGPADAGGWLIAEAASYAPVRARIDERTPPGTVFELKMPTGFLRGRAVGLDGAPVPTRLRLMWKPPPSAGHPVGLSIDGRAAVATNAEGRFEFRGVGEGEYRVLPAGGDASRVVGDWPVARAGAEDVLVVIASEEEARDLRVEVLLVDSATGKPHQGAGLTVLLVRPGTTYAAGLPVVPPVTGLQSVEPASCVYGTALPMRPGTYDVLVPPGSGFRESRLAGVKVPSAGDRARPTLTLDRGEGIRGRVLDADGVPAPGVVVRAGGQYGVAGPDGTYQVTGLDEGPVDVRVDGAYARSEPRRVVVRRGEPLVADFRVTTGGAIAIALPSTARPERRLLAVARPATEGPPSTLDLDASAVLDRLARGAGLVLPALAPGRWHVDVEWDGRPVASEDVDVEDRRTTTVRVVP